MLLLLFAAVRIHGHDAVHKQKIRNTHRCLRRRRRRRRRVYWRWRHSRVAVPFYWRRAGGDLCASLLCRLPIADTHNNNNNFSVSLLFYSVMKCFSHFCMPTHMSFSQLATFRIQSTWVHLRFSTLLSHCWFEHAQHIAREAVRIAATQSISYEIELIYLIWCWQSITHSIFFKTVERSRIARFWHRTKRKTFACGDERRAESFLHASQLRTETNDILMRLIQAY